MYNYNISKRLCEILNTEFDPTQLPSDQELSIIPEDALINPHKVYSNLGTIAAAEVNTGKKRPEHSAIMRKYYQEGKVKPPTSGRYKIGHKHSEESKRKMGISGSIARLGKKRGSYNILNRKIETCKCGRTISGAYNIRKHHEKCNEALSR
jgi:hypothetical protein